MTAPGGIRLPPARPDYNHNNESQMREMVQDALNRALKRDERYYATPGIALQSPDGNWWLLGVSNAGATTWTAITP